MALCSNMCGRSSSGASQHCCANCAAEGGLHSRSCCQRHTCATPGCSRFLSAAKRTCCRLCPLHQGHGERCTNIHEEMLPWLHSIRWYSDGQRYNFGDHSQRVFDWCHSNLKYTAKDLCRGEGCEQFLRDNRFHNDSGRAEVRKQLQKVSRALALAPPPILAECGAGCGRMCPEASSVCCKGCAQTGGNFHDARCDTWNAGREPGTPAPAPPTCQNHCGRPSAVGFRTCCRTCGSGAFPAHGPQCERRNLQAPPQALPMQLAWGEPHAQPSILFDYLPRHRAAFQEWQRPGWTKAAAGLNLKTLCGGSELYRLISDEFLSTSPHRSILSIKAVDAEDAGVEFTASLNKMNKRADTQRAHTLSELQDADVQLGLQDLRRRMQRAATSSLPSHTDIVFAWHGTKSEHANSVVKNGLRPLRVRDAGFFGAGSYTTIESGYAAHYCESGEKVMLFFAVGLCERRVRVLTRRFDYPRPCKDDSVSNYCAVDATQSVGMRGDCDTYFAPVRDYGGYVDYQVDTVTSASAREVVCRDYAQCLPIAIVAFR